MRIRLTSVGLIIATWTLFGTTTLTAQRLSTFHVIPQVADGTAGDGTIYASLFFVTKVSSAAVTCTITPRGISASRFIETSFTIASSDGGYLTSTNASGPLVSGYATVFCTGTVAVNTLYVYSNTQGVVSEATVFSASGFQSAAIFGIQSSRSRMAVAIANDSDTSVVCQIAVNLSGTLIGKDVTIPARSTVSRFVDELLPLSNFAGPMIVHLSANQPLYSIGLIFNGLQFATLPPTIYF